MNKNIYSWIWKWHFIGGLCSLPIIIILSVTGGIYLFKDNYEKAEMDSIKTVSVLDGKASFQEQWQIAKQSWDKKPSSINLPHSENEATEFTSGRFSNKASIFIDPYVKKVKAKTQVNQTDMYKVRKLHGELLMGAYGTKVVELVASWMVVLLLTGVYLFWPRSKGWRGFFTIRTSSKRLLYRDIHSVTGFWFSLILILILAGGLPWTDVFGNGYKWVQDKTNAGFPTTWQGRAFTSEVASNPLSLDEMVKKAKELNLVGEVSIGLPQSPKGVFSISNTTSQLSSMKMIHIDQYSGEVLYEGTWDDIGMMMKSRLWVMAFHQGEFGLWNWVLVLFTAMALLMLSVTAILSYAKRKKNSSWGIPSVPADLNVGKTLIGLTLLLGLLLPLFGLSITVIYAVELVAKRLKATQLSTAK